MLIVEVIIFTRIKTTGNGWIVTIAAHKLTAKRMVLPCCTKWQRRTLSVIPCIISVNSRKRKMQRC